MQITAQLDAATYRAAQPLRLTIDMTIAPGLHVYGQPIPEGFIPVSITVAPQAGLSVGSPEFPPPTLHRLEGLDEDFYIYEGTIQAALPLTFTQAGDDTTVEVTVGYQACSDELGCLMPQRVTVRLPVRAADHQA
jgi:DsbC/DsbD-like thiol-disulfide interchange protein